MDKLQYIIKIFKRINFKKFYITCKKIAKEKDKLVIIIIIDIIYCSIKYGAGYNDYLHFGFYNLNKKQRKTYITRAYNNKLVSMLNDSNEIHKLDNKNEFNQLFEDYLKRDWIYLTTYNYNEFEKWLKNKEEFIAKPNSDSGGHGIEKIIVKDYKTTEELYNYLLNKNLTLLEEIITQHVSLNKICNTSVNTIRIITINHKNKINFVISFLRIGNGSIVDNTCSGGMLTLIDLKTGITITPATNLNDEVIYFHPITKKEIKGIKIPYFKELKKLVTKTSFMLPNIKYIAWDVAITESGPVLVEGNPYPGYYYQFPIDCPNKEGFIPTIEKILK